jgi:hypothetical protein
MILNQSSDKDTYLILTGVSSFLWSLSFVSVTGISADSSILLVTCDCVDDDNRIQEATIQDASRTQGNNQWNDYDDRKVLNLVHHWVLLFGL